jgi:hypothetical protein
VQARHQEQAELSEVQDKLDAIAKVLADTRADADQVARALVQADRDVAAARVALAKADRRYRQARDRRAQAVREALLAKLEVDAQQALIDRRARETYVNGTPSMVLTLLADADTIADLLDRTKLLGEVAEAANAELAGLVDARVEAEEARQRAAAAEKAAREAKAVMRARAAEFEQIRLRGPPPSAPWSGRSPSSRSARVACAGSQAGSWVASGPRRRPGAAPRRRQPIVPVAGRARRSSMRTSTARPARARPATSGSPRPPSACMGW